MSNGKSVLMVTGVSGLLGANFALEATREWDVSGIYHDHPVYLPNIYSHCLDLLRFEELLPHLDRVRPNVIVHLAAATSVDWCEEHPEDAARMNVATTRYLAHWAASHDCKFLLMSTDSVFDGCNGGYGETDPIGPLNCYAATKCLAEAAVRNATSNHLIIRASIYGWNLQPKLSLAEWILSRADSGQLIPGFTDVIFTPVLVNTLSEIALKLLALDAVGTFHIASSRALSKYDFAEAIMRFFGLADGLVQPSSIQSAELRARRPLNTSLRTGKLQAECGIEPPTIEEDLLKFKRLRDSGMVARLKSMGNEIL